MATNEPERATGADATERNWREASLTELCDHIVDVHHVFLRSELPRIGKLLAKVAGKHGANQPQLRELESQFTGLHEDLIEHIDREEEGVFLLCRGLDEDGGDPPIVSPRLGMHEAAHAKVDQALATIRELAGGYRTEGALCRSHRVLLESLNALERDLRRHIDEENNMLFPRLRERLGEAQASVGT